MDLATKILFPIALVMFGGYVLTAGSRDHREAIKSLAEPKLSTEFGSTFWLRQRLDKKPVWDEARQVCSGGDEELRPRPNCLIVALVADDKGQSEFPAERDQKPPNRKARAEAGTGISSGLTGRGAQAGSLPTLRP